MTTLHAIVEALLFVARDPLSLDQLAKLIPDASRVKIQDTLEQLIHHLPKQFKIKGSY